MRPFLLALLALLVLAAPAAAQDPSDPGCFGETEDEPVEQRPGPPLRVGITPGVQTGQLGTGAQPPRTPEVFEQQVAALDRLRGTPAMPFVLRLHRFFWSGGEDEVRRFLDLANRYTALGFLVELQLRYHPNEEQEGDIPAWVAHVRDVVRRFGANRRVVAIQVTNEVNLTFSPDSSDGSYEGARDALVQGVIAAKDEATRRGYRQLEIGFNWAYRTDPGSEQSFWNGVRDRGGRAFVDAVDWVGLDAYPGTFFPPAEAPGEERDGMVNAMSSLRCYLRTPGIPESVPIHVEENGWPTGPGRSEERQVEVAETLIRAVHDFRGTYNVSDYRWFNLRDGNSQSGNYQTQYGLLRDDYSEKPAFGVVARLFAELGSREAGETSGEGGGAGEGRRTQRRSRPRWHVHCRRGTVRIHVTRAGRDVRRILVRAGGRRTRARRDARRPFALTVRGRRATLLVEYRDGTRRRLTRVDCARRRRG